METYFAPLDFGSVLAVPRLCPACGNADLTPVADQGRSNLRCAGCLRCWRPFLGALAPVDPATCADCGHRAGCLSRAGVPCASG
ncbi:hypothetical protein [Spirilliplanes yamanashiensis]|uniref:Uncharacterized protein n=1 Tax=Spirilliplanes yamanashiensis TaxID=42233 RepID=A0A8J3Y7R8_9ACTN|nr:hypothetical protein [Spirilliplanes yamanashiensis]MDP9817268.1 ribosomal protein S27E [Spirilliplanes yamanashiensis]GIJ03079.1 hypothetical protein Sya03_24310 [Spirilliplanes yamanashiensis]